VLLGMLTALDAMAIDSYLPALPAIARDMDASVVEAQVTLSIFLIGLAAGQALWGPISDRFGRRGPILAGLAVYCLGSLGGMMAPSMELLIAARFLQAIGASAGLVLARAIISDLWDPDAAARLYSIMMQVLGVTALVSPLLGGALLLVSGWRLIFLFLFVAGLATMAWSYAGIPESLPPERRQRAQGIFSGYGKLFRQPVFLLATIAAAFGTATMFATLSGSSFLFIDQYGWTSTEFSILYASSSVAFIGVCQINNWMLPKRGDEALLKIGMVLQFLITAAMMASLFAGVAGAMVFAVLWVLLMANLGILLGNAVSLAMRHAPEGFAGTASAFLGVLQFSVSALASPLAGASADLALSFAGTAFGCAGVALLATLLALRSGSKAEILR